MKKDKPDIEKIISATDSERTDAIKEENRLARIKKWERHYYILKAYEFACWVLMFGSMVVLFKFMDLGWSFQTIVSSISMFIGYFLLRENLDNLRLLYPERYNTDIDVDDDDITKP